MTATQPTSSGTTAPRRKMKRRYKVLLSIALALLVVGSAAGVWLYFAFEPPAPTVESGRIHVAAIGDSNTYGAGVLFDNRDQNSYPAQLEDLLGSDYQVLNYGLSGRTLVTEGDSPYDDNKFWSLSHDLDPDIVLIMLGTNDTKPQNWNADDYERELAAFVASYISLPNNPDVYLLTPPAAFPNDLDVDPQIVADQVVPIIERTAAAAGIEVIDVFAATRTDADLFPDGVHPNAEGYNLIARTVDTALALDRD